MLNMNREREQRFLETLWREQKSQGLSDYHLAQKLGVPPSTISRWKHGGMGVSADMMFRCAEKFPAVRIFLAAELLNCNSSVADSRSEEVA
jgi:transcriptional regulator with XRE-family HTH domain